MAKGKFHHLGEESEDKVYESDDMDMVQAVSKDVRHAFDEEEQL